MMMMMTVFMMMVMVMHILYMHTLFVADVGFSTNSMLTILYSSVLFSIHLCCFLSSSKLQLLFAAFSKIVVLVVCVYAVCAQLVEIE